MSAPHVFGWVVQLGSGKLARFVENPNPDCCYDALCDELVDAFVFDRQDTAEYCMREYGNGARVVPLVSGEDYERLRALLDEARAIIHAALESAELHPTHPLQQEASAWEGKCEVGT